MWNAAKLLVLALVMTSMAAGVTTAANPDSTRLRVKDSWWGVDKMTHAAVGFTIAGFATGIARNMLDNPDRSAIAIGISIPLGVGAIKEWFDSKHPRRHQASLKDIMAGTVGAALGAAFIISVSS